MDFSLGEDRQMLADTLGRLLTDRYSIEARNVISASPDGYSAQMWATFAELGIIGALFEGGAGGFGGKAFDIATVFEQLGKALVVEPFLGTAMAGHVLAQAGGQDELIAAVIGGERILAFAAEEVESRYDLRATALRAEPADGGGWRLNGAKAVVPQIEAASDLVVLARTSGLPGAEEGLSLFLVPAEQTGIRGYAMIDGGRGGEVSLDSILLPAEALIGEQGVGLALAQSALGLGTIALCWEAVGIMDQLKTGTLDYLRTRVQFGVPIGKFQALQHRMATLALEIEQVRSAAINAAAAFDDVDSTIRQRAISAAKYTGARVGTLVSEECIQLHGGIGMTWELPISHLAKRLTMIGQQLGDEDYHLERYIALAAA